MPIKLVTYRKTQNLALKLRPYPTKNQKEYYVNVEAQSGRGKR